ncbi:MAG: hypothetical protein LBH24_03250, partial [Clostridiales bacterium]|jgi:ribonuclease J|nr:hypothetical protein [Clostridiales bacterium]
MMDFWKKYCSCGHESKMFFKHMRIDESANECLDALIRVTADRISHSSVQPCSGLEPFYEINADITDYMKYYRFSALKVKVLRGQEKIGANIIELACYDQKILLDFGRELENTSGELTAIEKSILQNEYCAAFITHYHGDHAANISKLRCPVYMGKKCAEVIRVVADYTGKNMLPIDLRAFEDGKTRRIGPFVVTPYLCDHSAYDSYMLYIKNLRGDTGILYTGDFRATGRKSFEQLLARLPRNIDTLICEGTNIGQIRPQCTEREIERQAFILMQQRKKPVFVLQSSTNIDRLVSFYRAAKKAKRKFYMDDYQAQVCFSVGGRIPNPDSFDDVFAFKSPKSRKFPERFEEIENTLQAKDFFALDYVMLIRNSHLPLLRKISARSDILKNAVLIYSMWEGYKQNETMQIFLKAIEDIGIQTCLLHTSGHADENTINKLIRHTNAKEVVVVHTCPQ